MRHHQRSLWIGIAIFFKKAKKSAAFREQAKKFLSTDWDKQPLEQAGEKVLVEVYAQKEKEQVAAYQIQPEVCDVNKGFSAMQFTTYIISCKVAYS